MSFQTFSLHQLGWRLHTAQHLTLVDFEAGYPARVIAVHGDGLWVLTSRGQQWLTRSDQLGVDDVVVGDWVMVEHETDRVMRLIERRSLIARAMRGGESRQSIAANLDVLFVVAACNDDFDPARLERYVALALDAGVEPVLVLTKVDMAVDARDCLARAQMVFPAVASIAVNATRVISVMQLAPWLAAGLTVAFVGLPGAGKSALIGSLLQDAHRRETDAVQTSISHDMFPVASGAWIIDTPHLHALRLGPPRLALVRLRESA